MARKKSNPDIPQTAWAYVRLSRDDMDAPGPIEEKFEIRANICKRLAAESGLILPDDQILIEQKSGGKLSNRPQMLRLLELVKAGQVRHLITPYIDRLLRGDKRDEADIEDALIHAEVSVYTTKQRAPIEFGPDYDPTQYEIETMGARMELRSYARRRRATDREKLSMGKRSRSYAPYGYRYLRPTYDALRNLIAPASYEVLPGEFAVLEEIFRRIHIDSLRAICIDLNTRKVPPPGVGRREDAGDRWFPNSLKSIVRNPFYAGYLSNRSRVTRGRQTHFDPADYVLSDVQGDWPTLITLEEWQDTIAQWGQRKRNNQTGDADTIMTGLVFNSCGFPMFSNWSGYYCHCGDSLASDQPAHLGQSIGKVKFHTYVRDILAALVQSIHESAIPARPKPRAPDAKSMASTAIRLKVEIREAKANIDAMMEKADLFISVMREELYKESLGRHVADLEEKKAQLQQIEQEQAQAADRAEGEAIMPILENLTRETFCAMWDASTNRERRTLVNGIFKRIDLHTPPAVRARGSSEKPLQYRCRTGATVTLRNWCAGYLRQEDMPKMRGRYAKS